MTNRPVAHARAREAKRAAGGLADHTGDATATVETATDTTVRRPVYGRPPNTGPDERTP